jgi:hypothetical protein
MSDTGGTQESQDDQGLRDDSGSFEAEPSARRGIRSILRSYFAPLSPFEKPKDGTMTEGGFEKAPAWDWGDTKALLLACRRQFLFVGWIIGSFLFMVYIARPLVLSLLARYYPGQLESTVPVDLAVVVCVPFIVSVVLPLVVGSLLVRAEKMRGYEILLSKDGYQWKEGDGSSPAQPIALVGNRLGRIALAELWVEDIYGDYETDWTLIKTRPVGQGGGKIEEWVIRLADGEEKRIYFEHSEIPQEAR